MTKRADRRTGGLIPDLERDPAARFAYKRENRPWTPAQEAVLAAAVGACRSPSAYAMTCPNLLAALGHAPVDGPTRKRSLAKHQDTCVRAVELHLVTHMLGVLNEWTPPAIVGFQDRFRLYGQPLIWGEKVKVIRPYFGRVREQKSVVTFNELLVVLGRQRDPDDRAQVMAYLDRLRGPKFTDDDEPGAAPAVTYADVEPLAALVRQLDEAKGEDYVVLHEVWKLLTEVKPWVTSDSSLTLDT